MKAALLIGAVSAAIPLFEAPELTEVTDVPNGQVTWTGCDASTGDGWSFSSGSYSPDPFSAGDNLVFNMQGSVDGSITVTGVHVKLKWGAITLSDADHDLEQGPQTYDGSVDLTINFQLPGSAPSGKYVATVQGYDGSSSSGTNTCA